MIHNLPNILTIFRIVITPMIVWLLIGFDGLALHALALVLFLIASLTDLFDGIIARKLQVVSEFGKFMDPLADKILVNSTFITLNILDVMPIWITAVIILRDGLVTLLRWVMLANGASMNTSRMAKLKTVFQYISMYVGLIFILLGHFENLDSIVAWMEEWFVTETIFTLTGLVTAYTGFNYLWINRVFLKTLLTESE
ncbi:MAG: CDP-diacylglycerol--glycerol-3-phosphate 3-phosphatidyltransferase [Candidatus Marinimicrobia bacterium]|jgi:CDP-diacylglycerol---glycerol-3-phosphate 3-phosphatidyltransferase|nr:CDP-diacylglycerol--glycerol-3-phosphate 3-phosphatidyltransferase [Candidatus Neomarinimicrobiota bacterium]MBT4362174.1 CDP-diacylglycerol--glycerol-3-phosphate 3-phosphatidyltransferase [Candidatus Neomarinimicrobiota bacterium]MBT4716234.1 CDP-diacylglycerol--glycerol-3-phosphate 3-phosphatidyltransferase [Candidatus Neomarinimicrobiota bacterium]MBT4944644.1 CDP-diacylglycerol--glycerol-3-phosphate 3-phosphatidyltransferase [Candidatus Neomarinimicrobiota bacterium]MBT5270166.1 CDP-diac